MSKVSIIFFLSDFRRREFSAKCQDRDDHQDLTQAEHTSGKILFTAPEEYTFEQKIFNSLTLAPCSDKKLTMHFLNPTY